MKTTAIVSICMILSSPSPYAHAAPHIQFAGVCEKAEYELTGPKVSSSNTLLLPLEGSIVYKKLGLHLKDDKGRLGSAECTITTTIPAREGFRVTISQLKTEADAKMSDTQGLAALYVNHRFNGEDLEGLSSISRKDGKLVAEQSSSLGGMCGKEAVLRTKLTLKGKKSDIRLGTDGDGSVSQRYSYAPCEEKPENAAPSDRKSR